MEEGREGGREGGRAGALTLGDLFRLARQRTLVGRHVVVLQEDPVRYHLREGEERGSGGKGEYMGS